MNSQYILHSKTRVSSRSKAVSELINEGIAGDTVIVTVVQLFEVCSPTLKSPTFHQQR